MCFGVCVHNDKIRKFPFRKRAYKYTFQQLKVKTGVCVHITIRYGRFPLGINFMRAYKYKFQQLKVKTK